MAEGDHAQYRITTRVEHPTAISGDAISTKGHITHRHTTKVVEHPAATVVGPRSTVGVTPANGEAIKDRGGISVNTHNDVVAVVIAEGVRRGDRPTVVAAKIAAKRDDVRHPVASRQRFGDEAREATIERHAASEHEGGGAWVGRLSQRCRCVGAGRHPHLSATRSSREGRLEIGIGVQPRTPVVSPRCTGSHIKHPGGAGRRGWQQAKSCKHKGEDHDDDGECTTTTR